MLGQQILLTISNLRIAYLEKLVVYDSLPIEKTMTLHNVIILIKSVLNKDKNHYYYNTFLEKCLYQLAKK